MKEALQDEQLMDVVGGAEEIEDTQPLVKRRCRHCGRMTTCIEKVEEGSSGAPDFIHFKKYTYVCTVCGRVSVIQRKV